jgi:hypothetical protein
MKDFILFVRKQVLDTLPKDRHLEYLKSCDEFIGKLRADGKVGFAYQMQNDGVVISRREGAWKKIPYTESIENIDGYFHIQANNLDDAIAIAKTHPEFDFNPKGRIEIRPLMDMEEGVKKSPGKKGK